MFKSSVPAGQRTYRVYCWTKTVITLRFKDFIISSGSGRINIFLTAFILLWMSNSIYIQINDAHTFPHTLFSRKWIIFGVSLVSRELNLITPKFKLVKLCNRLMVLCFCVLPTPPSSLIWWAKGNDIKQKMNFNCCPIWLKLNVYVFWIYWVQIWHIFVLIFLHNILEITEASKLTDFIRPCLISVLFGV